MSETRNLGQIAAIYIGTTAPTNIKLIWYDNNEGEKIHKYYDVLTETWKSLADTGQDDNYRYDEYSIGGITTVAFNSVLASNLYLVNIEEFKATDGTLIRSGWTIDSLQTTGFRFTPPARYQTGIIRYKATLKK